MGLRESAGTKAVSFGHIQPLDYPSFQQIVQDEGALSGQALTYKS